jgi:hypothetical protein
MTRRQTYTDLKKTGQARPPIVHGQVLYKGFQCPKEGCTYWYTVKATELTGEYSLTCPQCGEVCANGTSRTRFDYELTLRADGSVIEAGTFEIYTDEYIQDATLLKYCLLCYELKPLSAFSRHSAFPSGHQGECRRCKTRYNAIKNQSRTADQHRDASQKRRLLVDLGGVNQFDGATVRARFGDKCFKCQTDISSTGAAFDHTLPVRYLWPMTTENATLLCQFHNGQKGALWPGEFYSDGELRTLAALTGISYDLLAGTPHINPKAMESLRDSTFVDALMTKYAHYIQDVMVIRNRILDLESFDFFSVSSNISHAWVQRADALRMQRSPASSE